MKKTTMLAFSAILAISGTALAQKADRDGNGSLSLAEFQASRSAGLLARDGDGDGRLTAAEWAARETQRAAKAGRDPARRHARFDRNRDGRLDRTEIEALLARRFARLDTNGDGALTREERAARRRDTAAAEE